jgi:hypothetical protein
MDDILVNKKRVKISNIITLSRQIRFKLIFRILELRREEDNKIESLLLIPKWTWGQVHLFPTQIFSVDLPRGLSPFRPSPFIRVRYSRARTKLKFEYELSRTDAILTLSSFSPESYEKVSYTTR